MPPPVKEGGRSGSGSGSGSVPPPIKFSAPRGGAGPRMRLGNPQKGGRTPSLYHGDSARSSRHLSDERDDVEGMKDLEKETSLVSHEQKYSKRTIDPGADDFRREN